MFIIANMGQDAGIAANMIKFIYKDKEAFILVHRTGNYRNPLCNFDPVSNTKIVVIGDILKPEHITQLRSTNNNITVLDYHKKFIEGYTSTESDILDPTCSLTELAWKFLFPEKETPMIIKFITDYETWTFSLEDTLPLHYGLGMESAYDDDFIVKVVNNNKEYLGLLLQKGRVVHRYVEVLDKTTAHDTFRLADLNGHECIAANVRGVNSLFFKNVKDDTRFKDINLFMTYAWVPGIQKYRCSLYSETDKADAGAIAQTFYGGGRPEVAGFNTEDVSKLLVDLGDKVEDDYEYMYSEVDALSVSPMVRSYTQNHERILVNSLRYYIRVLGKNAVVCNLPYPSPNIWFNARITNAEIGITYAMTSSGRYRTVITDFVGTDMQKLADEIGGRVMHNGTIWKYSDGEPWFNK